MSAKKAVGAVEGLKGVGVYRNVGFGSGSLPPPPFKNLFVFGLRSCLSILPAALWIRIPPSLALEFAWKVPGAAPVGGLWIQALGWREEKNVFAWE